MTVQIAGVASTKFGKHPGYSTPELLTEAAVDALEDASLSVNDIEELYVGNFIRDVIDDQGHVDAMLADYVGIRQAASMRIESACASASSSVRMGARAIEGWGRRYRPRRRRRDDVHQLH